MSDEWIYVGADINDHQWSKVGKTTRGLHSRHTSTQRPGYFIYTAYNIVSGDVHDIEYRLLNYLECQLNFERQIHFSTGSKSECFLAHPEDTACLVESFIKNCYSSCVTYEILPGEISRYQCDDWVYRQFDRYKNPSMDLPLWSEEFRAPFQNNLNMSAKNYFTGNQIEHEVDLGDGLFVDFATGLQGYRDEDGEEYFDELK